MFLPFASLAVKVPLDAYMMDFVFSEKEDGGIFDNKNGMDYHIPVFGGVVKEPPMHIVHIAVEMAPIAKVIISCLKIIITIALCFYLDLSLNFRTDSILIFFICCHGFLYNLNLLHCYLRLIFLLLF